MTDLRNGQITDLLSNSMRYNPETISIGYAIRQEKQRIMALADRTRLMSAIDSLDERILDYLAVELRSPFYRDNYSIESKRALIKGTLAFYGIMGTPKAVNEMLSTVFPGSYIEEWYTYGGEPYHFQVILETSRFRERANASEIRRAVNQCKRLTAHMDGLIYQCNIGITIKTKGHGYQYRSAWTGKPYAGTVPWRSTRGGLEHSDLEIDTAAEGYAYDAPMNGTQPYRNTRGGLDHSDLQVDSAAKGWNYTSASAGQAEAGTIPWRSTSGGVAQSGVEIAPQADGYPYDSAPAGTQPNRSTRPAFGDGGVEVDTVTDGFRYTSEAAGRIEAGTAPQRSTGGGIGDGGITVTPDTESWLYAATAAGTEPRRSTSAELREHGLFLDAEGKGHPYTSVPAGRVEAGTAPQRSMPFIPEAEGLQISAMAKGWPYTTLASGQMEAGTTPDRATGGVEMAGAFFAEADGEGFRYRVPVCGTSYCKSKSRKGGKAKC